MQQLVREHQPLHESNTLFPAQLKVTNYSVFRALRLLFVKMKVLESLKELIGRQKKKNKGFLSINVHHQYNPDFP